MRMSYRGKVLLAVIIMLSAFVGFAKADTLVLPGNLTVIDESAFEGDSSLDEVILGDNVERIESRAFAGTSIRLISMPESVSYIADDAFDGVANFRIDAPNGSYALQWAEENGINLNEDITEVVTSESLLAGTNMDIRIYGVKNAVEHGVYLINTETDEIVKRDWLHQKSGKISWEGYRLEAGTYKLIVYTITEDMGLLAPVSQIVEIVGIKPTALSFQIPESLARNQDYEFSIAPYEELYMRTTIYDISGEVIFEAFSFPTEDEFGYINTHWDSSSAALSISYCGYKDGRWSEWSPAYFISIVDREYIYDFTLPDEIIAGRDLEVHFSCNESIDHYNFYLERILGSESDAHQSVFRVLTQYDSPATVAIPGYILENAEYRIRIELYGSDIYDNYEKTFQVQGSRPSADINISVDKTEAAPTETVNLSINSDGTVAAYFRIKGERTKYNACRLSSEGTGNISTILDVIGSAKSMPVEISTCVLKAGVWSEWSAPIIVNVFKPEPLPKPIIIANDSYKAGEDITISVANVDDATGYNIYILEYYSRESIAGAVRNDIFGNMGEEFSLCGYEENAYKLVEGTYLIEVSAYSAARGNSTAQKIIRIEGTRPAAPIVLTDKDYISRNESTGFIIETSGCDQLYVQYRFINPPSFPEGTITIDTTEETTSWQLEGPGYLINFIGGTCEMNISVKKDGCWSEKTQLSLPII